MALRREETLLYALLNGDSTENMALLRSLFLLQRERIVIVEGTLQQSGKNGTVLEQDLEAVS